MSKFRFIALSGTTGVTENSYIYEYLPDGKNVSEAILVDCGVGFPDSDMFGVDLVIPDFSYIVQNKSKLKAVLMTHGHEDHIGALPFLLKDVDVPIFSTKLVAGFIKDKFKDYDMQIKKLNVFDPDKDVITIGSFKATPFRISHSVPDSVGFVIETPAGKMFHCADYKFDWTPVDKRPFDIAKAARLASDGCTALASDSIGSTTKGYTKSEQEIEDRIERIIRNASGKVYFTTISSNISRMQQAINTAKKTGRKVVFIGRSIQRKAEIARALGYLHYDRNLIVSPKRADKIPPSQVLYIISGSYGQPGSALYRVALGEHDFLNVSEADTVVFSSDPAPPGSKDNVDFVVDNLIEKGVSVHYYDIQENLHVSGHGSQEDIKMLFSLVRPKYFIPIGGTVRHMRAYRDLAVSLGTNQNNVFELDPGQSVEFENAQAKLGPQIQAKPVMVDGLGIGDVGQVVLRDRKLLSEEGVVLVVLKIDKAKRQIVETPDIVSRGFVYQGKERDFLEKSASILKQQIEKRVSMDVRAAKETTINFLDRHFYEQTGRRPMILPVIVEV